MRAALTTLVLALALLVPAATASAGGTAPAHARIGGVVPHTGIARIAGSPHALSKSAPFSTAGFLGFDANYESLINQYFTDVAHDSGGTSNVYSTDTQYYDSGYTGSGAIQYQSTFGGSYVDHDPLPANGCDDGLDAVCLTDQQLEDEIQNALSANGWHGDTSSMFVLLTPNGVGSCFDSTSTTCTTNVYCAYHSAFLDSNSEPVIYVNEPYNATLASFTGTCDPGSSPNGDDADASINTLSHEHNEAITDPFLDAWYSNDTNGDENGDLCAWGFGTKLGGTGATQYNQVINGHDYWLQQEYSNADSGCVQYSGGTASSPTSGSGPLVYHTGGSVMHTNTVYAIYWLPTSGNTAAPVVTGTAAAGHTLASSTGSWTAAPSGYSYQWQRCSSAGAGCVDIPGATNSTYLLWSTDVGKYVRSTVSAWNANGQSSYAPSAGHFVAPLPTATGLPVVSGVAAVGKTLTATTGTWNTPATFTYRWLACSSTSAASCAGTQGTGATYRITEGDAGYMLRVVVYASNAAGTSDPSESAPTAVVVPLPSATKAPAISGVAAVGKTLTSTAGTWNTPASLTYQWLRCDITGSGCTTISGATTTTHLAVAADAGHTLKVAVSATNIAGTTQALSVASEYVVAVPHPKRAPRISGRLRVGRRLSASHGSWTGPPANYRYQWFRCNSHGAKCRRIRHATHTRYKLTRHDAGHKLRVRVTAVNVAGKKSATSRPTKRVPAVRRLHR